MAPLAEAYEPTWLIISAGFDAHRRDPLTDMGLTSGDYALMTKRLMELVPAGRHLMVLEGGYDLQALSDSSAASMAALLGVEHHPEKPSAGGPGRRALDAVAEHWGDCRMGPRSPDLGVPSLLAVVPDRFAPVLEDLRPLAERFRAAGHRLYLVGGTVRDLLVGREAGADIDATTDARPPEIKAVLAGWADALWTQGERFGTIGAQHRGRPYEITTHRAEAYAPESRKPEVVFADAVETDLSRRDFTVNAMALELTSPSPSLVDPFGGAADLAAGVLRTPLSPEESFSDDPLRMLRAARFLAGYHLQPVPELTAAVTAMHHRLSIVSAERIRDELDKLIVVDRPGPGLWFVIDTGLAEEFLPELPGDAPRAGPHPPAQGRAQPHHRRRRERAAGRRRRTSTSASPAWPRCSTTSASRRPGGSDAARG